MGTAATAMIALAIGWAVWPRTSVRPPGDSRGLADLIAAVAAGSPGAVERARAAADRDWPACRGVLIALLGHDNWRVRRLACDALAARRDEQLLAFLLPRANDRDWRVRAVAFEALGRLHPPPGEPPHRDTPIDERDRFLLRWMDERDAAAPTPIGPDLCELYADARRVEFGRPLALRCHRCHVGRRRLPFEAGLRCAKCHALVHSQWAGSAHAQSLTHLRLVTIDAATRQPALMSFAPVWGISCAECHEPRAAVGPAADAPAAASRPSTAPATRPKQCPETASEPEPTAETCARCHHATAEQWHRWLRGNQPRRAVWPPGQIDTDVRGDTRDCVDCHMPRPPVLPPSEAKRPRSHEWAARRSQTLLAAGIDLRVERLRRDDGSSGVRFLLINLSGHEYPTGTRRRAVRLYASDANSQEAPPLATLAPRRPGRPDDGTDPPLAPGEQRAYVCSPAAPGAPVVYRLVYYRNPADPGAHTVVLHSGTVTAGRPVDPQP